MAIDASIYQLANKPTVALQDPTDSMAKALQMQSMMAQNQIQQQGIQDANDFRQKYGMSPGMAKNVKDLQTGQYQAEHAKSLALNEHLKSMEGLAGQQNTVYQAALDALNQDPAAAPAIHQATLAKTAQNAQQLGIDTSVSNDPKGFVAPAASLPPEAGPDIAQPSPTWDVDQQKQWLKQKISETTPESVRTKLAELAIQQQKADAENWQLQPVQGGFIRYNKKSGEVQPVEGGYKPMPTSAQVQLSLAQGSAPKAIQNGATGQEALDALQPNVRNVVNAIIDGRQSAPSGMAQKTPYWQGIMQSVYAVDPQWSEQRAQTRKAFATGKDGTNIGSLNTATVHLADYLEAAEALKNGTFTPGNAFYNKISSYLGKPAPTDFATFKNIVSGEMANALKGNATDVEIHHIQQTMDGASSPDQFVANGKDSMKAMYQKLNTYQERYSQQIPEDSTWSPILPSAKAVFNKYGISGGDKAAPAASGFVPKNEWQLSAPSGNPDVSTKGTNARFPNAVWTKDGPSGPGWYAKFGGQIGRVE